MPERKSSYDSAGKYRIRLRFPVETDKMVIIDR